MATWDPVEVAVVAHDDDVRARVAYVMEAALTAAGCPEWVHGKARPRLRLLDEDSFITTPTVHLLSSEDPHEVQVYVMAYEEDRAAIVTILEEVLRRAFASPVRGEQSPTRRHIRLCSDDDPCGLRAGRPEPVMEAQP